MSYSNYYASSGLFHGSLSGRMGTQLDVLLFGADSVLLSSLWEEIEAEVIRLDSMLNRFDTASEVSGINKQASVHPVGVQDELWDILQDCKRYYEWTEGYFDITLSDFGSLVFSASDKSIFFTDTHTSLDFGGYGKGYALVRIRQLLDAHAIRKAFVNFGNSSVLAIGSHPHGLYWPIGIENPFQKGEVIGEVHLCNNSLSTSGNMPSHPKHIVNPHSKEYNTERKLVSVISASPVDAEVLTTTLMVADEAAVLRIIDKFDSIEKHIYTL